MKELMLVAQQVSYVPGDKLKDYSFLYPCTEILYNNLKGHLFLYLIIGS